LFEDYLQDAHYFADEARALDDERASKRSYRAAVFCIAAAVEAYVNYVGDTLEKGARFDAHEIAFLTDRKFGLNAGKFQMLKQNEFHRLEDKLVFLLTKFGADFDRASNPAWPRFQEFKKFRDSITHSRTADDEISLNRYAKIVTSGLSSSIVIIDSLCKCVFGRHLRRKILDLARR
jgi:hypothetical protein